MTSDDDFGDGAHADGIATEATVGGVFGGSLVGGAGEADVDTFPEGDALLEGDLFGGADEVAVVGAGHVGEAWAEAFVVGADERVGHHVDMIADDHEVADVEGVVNATGGVGDEQAADTEEGHDADGEGDLTHGVSFIIMEAALHGHDRLTAEAAEEEVAFVARGRGAREVGDGGVGDGGGIGEAVGQSAEAAAEDDGRPGHVGDEAGEEVGGFLIGGE